MSLTGTRVPRPYVHARHTPQTSRSTPPYLGENLLPLSLVAKGVPPKEMRLQLQTALLQRVLYRFLDLLGVVSDVFLARALLVGAVCTCKSTAVRRETYINKQ